tara:strand:+ start:23273 stop:24490 length:1218 start_codon:yes stop_codon:yes gene_type:complete
MSLFENDVEDTPHQIPEVNAELEDGVYFNQTDEQYHKIERYSASGIKSTLVSIPTFWAGSWMNPDKEAQDNDTDARILGRAYHAAIFEPETLASRFVGAPDLSKYDNLITSDSAVCAKLKELGQTQKKAGETAVMRALRLHDLEPKFNFASIIIGEWRETLKGQTEIAPQYWAQIQQDLQRIEDNPEIYDLVTGGFSEVTILWTCPDSGIRMKARIDKLKADCFVDLKSFANALRKPTERTIIEQVMYNGYYISMRVYQHAIAMIAQLDLKVMDEPGGETKAEIGEVKNEQNNLIDALKARTTPLPAWLFFQEKGGIPNLLARRLMLQSYPSGTDPQSIGAEDHQIKTSDSALCMKADIQIRHAKKQFNQAMEIYGPDAVWYSFNMVADMGDSDFNDWFLNEVPR